VATRAGAGGRDVRIALAAHPDEESLERACGSVTRALEDGRAVGL
jgi:hypothetical protein